jgi:ABC-type polysaccharide/polyol phosphate export permease
VLVSGVDFLVSTSVLALLMFWFGVTPGWALLYLPSLLAVQLMIVIAVSLLLSMANLFYRDVKYLVEVVMSLSMFATSVVYPVDRIGGKLGALVSLNPMIPLVDAYRSVILYNRPPDSLGLAYVTVLSVVLLAGAWLVFHRAEFKFAESV